MGLIDLIREARARANAIEETIVGELEASTPGAPRVESPASIVFSPGGHPSQQVGQRMQYLRCTVAQSFTSYVPPNKSLSMQLTGLARKSDGSRVLLGQQGQGWIFTNPRPDRIAVVSDLYPIGDPLSGGADLAAVRLQALNANDTLPIGMAYGMMERVFLLDDQVTIVPVETLARGYFNQWQPLSWPNDGHFLSSLDGPGANILVALPNTTGSLAVTVPLGATWRPKALTADLTCTGAGGPRQPGLRYGATPFLFSGTTQTIPAGTTGGFSAYAEANPTINVFGLCTFPLPVNVRLGPLGRIQVDALNQDPADLWTSAFFQYEEWLNFTG